MRLGTFAIPALLIVATGCVAPDATPRVKQRTQAVFNAPKDKVWQLIIEEIGMNYPVQALEKASGLITTQQVRVPVSFNNGDMEKWAYNPGGFLATWNGLRVSLQIMAIESEGPKTQVSVKCDYQAFEDNVQKAWIPAESNGALENKILSAIETKLKAVPAQ